MSELSLRTMKQLMLESMKSTESIRDLVNETAMQLLVDKVNELQKKVDELEKESQWLPMDTAPKDGTEILVLFKRIGAKMVSWTTRDSEPWSEYAHWHVDDGKYDPYPLRGYNEEDEVGWKPQPRVSDDTTN